MSLYTDILQCSMYPESPVVSEDVHKNPIVCIHVCIIHKSNWKGHTDFILYNLILKVHQLKDFSRPMRVLHAGTYI